ncbi:Acg family FMN-binding oxidoreductase [Gemmatimonas groenlandica]|uniref:Nitroreductase domain-containing protein n=1 Tax=Gemmatimonas groenlandica TaxID=2732249 RepID=A0A6M4IZM4_9BACT|nr:hypothetical protein [Gemmatimonas groenlandica]QJR37661.1 hypothetical protein HKW67_20125 [Gemmatimonas groenlandica]
MHNARRDAVKRIASTALAVGVAPLLSACLDPTREDRAQRDDVVRALDPALADVLYHASLAPSGHNAQPWMIGVTAPNRLVISTARDRWLHEVDPQNRELLLSFGCFLENMIVTARHRGFHLEYQLVGTSPATSEILDVTLRRATPVAFPLESIQQRRTVRSHHLRAALTRADVQAITAPFGDHAAYFPFGSTRATWLAEQTIEANRVQAYREPAQRELSEWIRWADDDARRERNGLTPASMEITGLSGWYVRHFMTRADVMKPKFREQGLDAVRAQVGDYGGWLVITSADASMSTLIETGRLVERMWLGCRARMIAIHPMTQILEESPFRDQVGAQLGLAGRVQFLLRVSYIKEYPAPVSLRMPLSRLVSTL